jgi:hypothetical protein
MKSTYLFSKELDKIHLMTKSLYTVQYIVQSGIEELNAKRPKARLLFGSHDETSPITRIGKPAPAIQY